jgi:hypothetical protein
MDSVFSQMRILRELESMGEEAQIASPKLLLKLV